MRRTVPILLFSTIISGCGTPGAGSEAALPVVPLLPVATIHKESTTTYRDYSTSLEGKVNVEIRSQVDGYLDKIFVDEGAYVKAGQPLFQIDDHTYREQLNTAIAGLHASEANLATAQIEVDKLEPLVANQVISPVQLKTAKSNLSSAKAATEQARAAIASARINLNFCTIKAPVTGYIGRIPKRIGNLISKSDSQGLTTLSDIEEIYAYFSMGEADFLHFNQHNKGNSQEDKIRGLLPVSLVLADGSIYPLKGKVDLVNGQFDKTTGAISMRASFPNPDKAIRSGSTGKIRMEEVWPSVLLVPIAATIDLQDKIFVFSVADSNKVKRQAIRISGKSGDQYIVAEGLKEGDRIVTVGLGTLTDGAVIQPQPVK